jgi:hypothetical protein
MQACQCTGILVLLEVRPFCYSPDINILTNERQQLYIMTHPRICNAFLIRFIISSRNGLISLLTAVATWPIAIKADRGGQCDVASELERNEPIARSFDFSRFNRCAIDLCKKCLEKLALSYKANVGIRAMTVVRMRSSL